MQQHHELHFAFKELSANGVYSIYLNCRAGLPRKAQNDDLIGFTLPPFLTATVIIKIRRRDCCTNNYFIFGTARRRISSAPSLAAPIVVQPDVISQKKQSLQQQKPSLIFVFLIPLPWNLTASRFSSQK